MPPSPCWSPLSAPRRSVGPRSPSLRPRRWCDSRPGAGDEPVEVGVGPQRVEVRVAGKAVNPARGAEIPGVPNLFKQRHRPEGVLLSLADRYLGGHYGVNTGRVESLLDPEFQHREPIP